MMKKVGLLAVLMFVVFMASAAESASSILRQASDKLTKSGTLTASFSMADPDNGDVTGTIYVSGDKFAIRSTVNTNVYDGKTQWTVADDVREISIYEPDDEEIQQINPFAVINSYASDYKSSIISSSSGIKKIQLTPKDTSSSIIKIIIVFDEKTLLPNKMTLAFSDGNVAEISVNDIRLGVNIPANQFVINTNDYPDYDVIDLR